jgi:glutamate synthase domain-containing protein 3
MNMTKGKSRKNEKKEITIDALDEKTKKPLRYKILNNLIHNAADSGYKQINVTNVLGQRFIAACMEYKDVKIDIYGTPGNDLGIFMDGPTIEVHGNCEDQTGNTLNSGTIIVHGNAWDVTGLAARGGKIFVRGNGGYRIGIHMKAYMEMKPMVVYGGTVKEFFGEYMAGGILVALGMQIENGTKNPHPLVEDANPRDIVRGSLGTGIHGGAIYLRGDVDEDCLGVGATVLPIDSEDEIVLKPILEEFSVHFKVPMKRIMEREFVKVVPASARPYGSYYNYRSV